MKRIVNVTVRCASISRLIFLQKKKFRFQFATSSQSYYCQHNETRENSKMYLLLLRFLDFVIVISFRDTLRAMIGLFFASLFQRFFSKIFLFKPQTPNNHYMFKRHYHVFSFPLISIVRNAEDEDEDF